MPKRIRAGLWLVVTLGLFSPAIGRADREVGRDAARAHFQRGMAQYELEHYDQAIAEFEAGFAASPQAAFLFNLALVHAKRGDKEIALKFYHKYLDRGVSGAEAETVRGAIEQLEQELRAQASAPPARPAPVVTPVVAPVVTPVVIPVVTPPSMVATEVRSAPPPRRRRAWPIAVGVVGGVVVVGVVVGLALGLSQPTEPVLQWSAR